MVESGGNPYVMRFEPKYIYTLTPAQYAQSLGITRETEEMLQKHSWGLVQCMGSVCRELGHKGHLTELLDKELNLDFGARKIKSLLQKYDERSAIAAYNAGSPRKTPGGNFVNQVYVDKVYGYLNTLRGIIP